MNDKILSDDKTSTIQVEQIGEKAEITMSEGGWKITSEFGDETYQHPDTVTVMYIDEDAAKELIRQLADIFGIEEWA